MSSEDQIRYLIKARYPLIYVVSPEEERVEKALVRIANDCRSKPVWWSITQGFSEQGGADIREPVQALQYILEAKENAIYVLRDLHEFMGKHIVKRLLRDLARELRTSSKNCVLLSPVKKIPPEIEKEFAIVDFDLPKIEDIYQIMNRLLDKGVGPESKAYAWKLEFQRNEEEKLKVAEAALGLTSVEIDNVLAKSLVMRKRFDIEVIHSEKEQIIRKSGILDFLHPDASFAGVGGLDLLKVWLRKRAKAFSKEARAFGLPEPKGILMLGIPGCGKSLMAKAVASLWRLPLIRLDIGKVFGSLVGSSEEGIRKAIRTAESVAPCILWLDELEKGLSGVQSSGQSDGGTTARVFGTFITWLQEKTSPVFVIGTANNIKQLPPELLRKGRFDEIFFVDLPSPPEREQIFKIHIQARGREPSRFDLERLVEETDGYSGSEIEQIVISALYDAYDRDDELNDMYLFQAIKETVPLSRTMSEEIASMRDWAKSRARLASKAYALEEREVVRKIDI
ncbi:MAG: AAA family ATPase [Planctomycetota bacterium]|nr:MAG: AAA family ATPase [Planctomycetota bacterium]